MTSHRGLKRLVRARMEKTGQRYASARRSILREGAQAEAQATDGFLHLPGVHPDCSSLRILLANAGVSVSEAMVFGIAGGAGAGVMAFRYEREDVSTFYLTGWNVFQSSAVGACGRLGITPTVTETTGARTAERQLGDLLSQGVPAMAWVDLAVLGYAGLPPEWAGGAYHVVVVYADDSGNGVVRLGDRAPQPIEVPSEVFAAARSRIRKDRHRLLSLGPDELEVDLEAAVRAGLRAAAEGPATPTYSMSLEGVRTWAERISSSTAKGSWARVFPRGRHLWGALRGVYEWTEHNGSGGGLMRPLYARFLTEAAEVVGDPRLGELAERYAALGRGWTDLARAALPDEVPALRRTRELVAAKDQAFLRDGSAASDRVRAAWRELDVIGEAMRRDFPLDEPATTALLAGLKVRIEALYADEIAARDLLAEVAGAVNA